MSSKSQELLRFVRRLPLGIAYAPIYGAGCLLQSGKESKGKTPLEASHHRVMGPADVALVIERQPEVFQAVGAFTGMRSGGLVILDVDANLSKLQVKWGDSLVGAPVVRSTKANAAKFLFRVPEGLWGQVKGFGLSESGQGYEVLWGRQGLLFGAYPGSSDGKAPAGVYGFEGNMEAIPEAPEWLLAEMRSAKGQELQDGGFIKNRKALQFGDRTPEEVAEIVQCCLSVIPQQGAGSRDHWLKIGMAVHSALPNDLGLVLWSAWSADDPEYSDDWESSNPCEEVWKSFKANGPVTLGTLFWMADQMDPARRRFPEDVRKIVEEAEGERVQKTQYAAIGHAEIIQRAEKAMQLDNPSEVQHRLHEIALAAGYRDAAAIVKLLIAHQEFKRGSQGGTAEEIFAQEDDPIDYLIPDLLPKPGTVLIHGAGGDGKTMAVMTLAKHISQGIPFSVRGALVPVERGPVLWLNGDQNSRRLKSQMVDVGIRGDGMFHVRNKVSMLWYPWFIRLMEEVRPSLVVWDSVTACMRGSAFDQNKAEYAEPLYWYSAENGESFPATTIVFIHHANKEGGFRGTTALQDAVDESWGLRKPKKDELEALGGSSRLITIHKSREGNTDKQMVLRMEDDLSFSLRDHAPEASGSGSEPASIIDRVLQRLRTARRPMTRQELNSDPLCGGKVAAIQKALQRLVDRKLVVPATGERGVRMYQAVLVPPPTHTRVGDVPWTNLSTPPNPSAGAGSGGWTRGGQIEELSTHTDVPVDKSGSCPPLVHPLKASAGAASGGGGQKTGSLVARARTREGCEGVDTSERSDAEIGKLEAEAAAQWD